MNALQPNTRFLLFGSLYKVDYENGSTIRFHRESDQYDVYELQTSWLTDKMRAGRLKIVID